MSVVKNDQYSSNTSPIWCLNSRRFAAPLESHRTPGRDIYVVAAISARGTMKRTKRADLIASDPYA